MKHRKTTNNLTIHGRKITAYKMVFQKNGRLMETADYTDLTILEEIKRAAVKFGYKYIKTITI